jgi:pilus assembly protein CpaE
MEKTTDARPIPRISIQAFCEDSRTVEAAQIAARDRRFAKVHMSINSGGAPAALAQYQEAPTPNLIIIESTLGRQEMLDVFDRLAECCDANTRVMAIAHINDDVLRRELLERGVNDFLIAPIDPIQLMESISNIYKSGSVGRIITFLGAKDGVGSSTICHDVSWSISNRLKSEVVVADLDFAFGTASYAFNQDPGRSIYDALSSSDRVDEVLLDRLLTKCSEHLSLLAAPAMLERGYDLSAESCDPVLDLLRQNVPFIAIDLPHTWTHWSKRVLFQSDEVVITAVPDLANLRNAKKLVDVLKTQRPHDTALPGD